MGCAAVLLLAAAWAAAPGIRSAVIVGAIIAALLGWLVRPPKGGAKKLVDDKLQSELERMEKCQQQKNKDS